MVDKIEVDTELNIKIDDVASYLAYLALDGVEPNVDDRTKEFCEDLLQKFDIADGLGYKGAKAFDGNGSFYSNRDQDAETMYAFDDSEDAIYSVLTDIVKHDFDGSWLELIFSLLDNVSPPSTQMALKTQYRDANYENGVLGLQHVKDLVDDEINDNAQLVLDLKAGLLAQVSRSVNKIYFAKYSAPLKA